MTRKLHKLFLEWNGARNDFLFLKVFSIKNDIFSK